MKHESVLPAVLPLYQLGHHISYNVGIYGLWDFVVNSAKVWGQSKIGTSWLGIIWPFFVCVCDGANRSLFRLLLVLGMKRLGVTW